MRSRSMTTTTGRSNESCWTRMKGAMWSQLGTGPPMTRRADVASCSGLRVLAVWLPVGALSPPSLWRDDAWQALVVRVDRWDDIGRMGQSAPGFSVLLQLWLSLVGFSSMAAQTLPFAAGVAAA